jgi:hypothetical protein
MNNPEVFLYFPEPVLRYKFKDYKNFNLKLKRYIYELQKENSSGPIRSNRGGWHSPYFKLTDKNSIQNKFALELQKYIFRSFQTLGWKTENKKWLLAQCGQLLIKKMILMYFTHILMHP